MYKRQCLQGSRYGSVALLPDTTEIRRPLLRPWADYPPRRACRVMVFFELGVACLELNAHLGGFGCFHGPRQLRPIAHPFPLSESARHLGCRNPRKYTPRCAEHQEGLGGHGQKLRQEERKGYIGVFMRGLVASPSCSIGTRR